MAFSPPRSPLFPVPVGPRRPADSAAGREALLARLLVDTSRTFALCVPELPRPTEREVTIAYLLFRIADTFEDATVRWDKADRSAALEQFVGLLARPSSAAARELSNRWTRNPPTEHRGYMTLLARTPEVIEEMRQLSPDAQQVICRHATRTARRMAGFVATADDRGELRLESLARLRDYCYAVAGIVGEMLTELFVLGCPALAPQAGYLAARAPLFGEGLQLVNILKDSAVDATEGRSYLPAGVDRREVFTLARTDLEAAAEYCLAIQRAGGPPGMVAFTALPIELAWATLDKVERHGPGAKISRGEVFLLRRTMRRAIAAGRPVLASVTS